VPSVWVNGKFVGGCNDGPESWMGIKKIINNNKLDELLA
jgi:glutaredoxin-related protein